MAGGDETLPLFTERAAAVLGLDRVAEAVGRPGLTPYLAPLLGWVLDFVVLSSLSYLLVDRQRFDALSVWLIPVGLVVGVVLAQWLRDRYVAAVENLPGDTLSPAALRSLPTGRFRVAVYLAFVAGNYAQLVLSPREVAAFAAVHGEAIAYAKYLFASPLYFTLFADLAALLLAGMVVLPWRLYNANLALDFSDVTGFAGLYEVGRLLWAGSVTYFVGLTMWTAFLVLPTIVGANDTSTADVVVFSALWVAGFLLYVGPVWLLHRHMTREKERHVREIDAEIRALDPKDNDRGVPYLEPASQDIPRLQQKFLELQQVRNAREYPANTAIVEELALAAILPLAFQWSLTNVPGLL